jgi:DNA-binding transcriptional MerR regulator
LTFNLVEGVAWLNNEIDDVELLRFVRRLRGLELPLDDVREIVALRTRGEAPCAMVRTAIAREAVAIDRRIEDLLQLRDELSRLRTAADKITDDWPTSCVCHILEPVTVN